MKGVKRGTELGIVKAVQSEIQRYATIVSVTTTKERQLVRKEACLRTNSDTLHVPLLLQSNKKYGCDNS